MVNKNVNITIDNIETLKKQLAVVSYLVGELDNEMSKLNKMAIKIRVDG